MAGSLLGRERQARDAAQQAVRRGLRTLGLDEAESAALAAEAAASLPTELPDTNAERGSGR